MEFTAYTKREDLVDSMNWKVGLDLYEDDIVEYRKKYYIVLKNHKSSVDNNPTKNTLYKETVY